LADRLEIHHTPKHGSWLNMAEIELSALGRQCLSRRIAHQDTLRRQIAGWEEKRNAARPQITWQFTTQNARTKLRSLYPSPQPRKPTSGLFAVGLGSAPGDRPGVVGESPIRRRSSDPRRPRAVRVWPRGQGRSVGRGTCRPAIEPRKSHGSGCRRCYQSGRPHERGRQREPPVDPAWSETLACTHAPGTGTGRSPARPQALGPPGPHREGEEP